MRFENGGLNLRCVIGKSAGFGMGYGFKAQSGGKFGGKKAGKLQLPGQIFEEKKAEAKQAFKKKKGGLKNKMSGAPTGSCETSIDMAIEGHVQNALIIGMHTNGPFTTIDISGGVGVSLDGMIKAQGSCTLTAEKRFPKVPKKKVICYKGFCIVLFLQMVAQLEITGALTGTLELGAEVGFDIEGKITVDKTTGKATAEFKAPSVDRQAKLRDSGSPSAREMLTKSLRTLPLLTRRGPLGLCLHIGLTGGGLCYGRQCLCLHSLGRRTLHRGCSDEFRCNRPKSRCP